MAPTRDEMKTIVRVATERDAAEIAALCSELGNPTTHAAMQLRLREVAQSPTNLVMVADAHDGAIAGWIHAHAIHVLISGFRVEIAGLVVSSAHRRKGVGRKLVQAVEMWTKKLGAPEIVVRSNILRTESHAFYPAIGYSETKVQRVYRKVFKQR